MVFKTFAALECPILAPSQFSYFPTSIHAKVLRLRTGSSSHRCRRTYVPCHYSPVRPKPKGGKEGGGEEEEEVACKGVSFSTTAPLFLSAVEARVNGPKQRGHLCKGRVRALRVSAWSSNNVHKPKGKSHLALCLYRSGGLISPRHAAPIKPTLGKRERVTWACK